MNVPYSHQELKNACQIIVSSNDLNEGAYIRPIAFRGYDDLGLHAHDNDAIDVVVAAWEWGPYLGNASLNDGVDACVSSWNKINPNTVPFMAKASGNYLSGTLVAMEARQNGYDEGILLDSKGMVSEGAGENIFMVKDGNLYTPPLSSSVLDGITRDAVIKIAGSLKLGVIETEIPREQLYIADELFFTGTAVEITPIKSVDKITIGTGTKGPVTAQIQKVFFGLFDGSTEDSWGWLEPVE
jgi:branched-chain amino acid aminotransferase